MSEEPRVPPSALRMSVLCARGRGAADLRCRLRPAAADIRAVNAPYLLRSGARRGRSRPDGLDLDGNLVHRLPDVEQAGDSCPYS